MNFFETIGMNICDLIKQKGWNNVILAEKIGVSKQVIGKILKGQKAINALEIKKISDALGVSMDEIIKERKQTLEPSIMFMGNINEKNIESFQFLDTVIREVLTMEAMLDD